MPTLYRIRMNIYVASSWRNQHHEQVVAKLRGAGHEVYNFREGDSFKWQDVSGHLDPKSSALQQFYTGLRTPEAQAGFKRDRDALEAAHLVVLLLPCGKSAHLEAGWAMGRNKPVIVVLDEDTVEPELMYLLSGEFTTRDALLRTVGYA